MTTFKCLKCESFWSEGPTRDYRMDKVCRVCLERQVEALLTRLEEY